VCLVRMITKKRYVEYLLNTLVNYTCSNLSNHTEKMSHDVVSDFLRREKFTPAQLWELVRGHLTDSQQSYLIVDDSVQDKRYSSFIELVKKQYSGNVHGLIKGIGVVNMVHSNGKDADYFPIDYRIYAPHQDGKTKNDHFQQMFISACHSKQIKARTILFDCWYASVGNLKLVHRCGWTFFTTLKSNRMVSLSKEEGYIHLQDISWNEESLQHGLLVKLKEVPFLVRLFKIVTPNGDIEWIMTNDVNETMTATFVQQENKVRWQVEELHRGLKQLTGTEKCQCRSGRAQRNHMACCYHAWVSLKIKAKQLGLSLYQVKSNLWTQYLKVQLKNPSIQALV
jgi:hypothetical protein